MAGIKAEVGNVNRSSTCLVHILCYSKINLNYKKTVLFLLICKTNSDTTSNTLPVSETHHLHQDWVDPKHLFLLLRSMKSNHLCCWSLETPLLASCVEIKQKQNRTQISVQFNLILGSCAKCFAFLHQTFSLYPVYNSFYVFLILHICLQNVEQLS